MPTHVSQPVVDTETPLFTALTDFYVSNIFVCATESAGLFSVGVKVKDSATTTWMFCEVELKKSETFTISGVALSAGDSVQILTNITGIHFTLTGDGT